MNEPEHEKSNLTLKKHSTATNKNSLDFNPFNRKLALVGIIPNEIPFSFISNNDRRATESQIRRKNTAQPIFVGAEKEENLIGNDPDKSEFIERI